MPLEEINIACSREKSIRHGHPSSLHLWWARRPLAAARAVLFSQMIDDPSSYVDELKCDIERLNAAERALGRKHQKGRDLAIEQILIEQERERLFKLIARKTPKNPGHKGEESKIAGIVAWPTTNIERAEWERDMKIAREEIRKSWQRALRRESKSLDTPLPAFHDPFAGGGTIPLEAQRLGLESYASDLNPVPVLINKAMIEIPPKFADRPPVHPEARQEMGIDGWNGTAGLAEDLRRYAKWMRDEAFKRIGNLYPQIEITNQMAQDRPDLKPLIGQKITIIAWLWARTVKSPNPTFNHVHVPLAASFILSTKDGKQAYVEPIVEADTFRLVVKMGAPINPEQAENGTKAGARGADFICVLSRTPIEGKYIKSEASAGRMGAKLMAMVADAPTGRIYLSPTSEMEALALQAKPTWKPEAEFFEKALGFRVGNYGIKKWADLFTSRQLIALATFADLIPEAREKVKLDLINACWQDDRRSLEGGGSNATAYADALAVYLALGVSKLADYNASLVQWSKARDQAVHVFGRQALPMVWDYAEVNVFAQAAGDLVTSISGISKALESISSDIAGYSEQQNASNQTISTSKIISTDPPYYDNIGYADLSDFFYVWLRKSLHPVFPKLFSTVTVPKAEELVATPARHGGKDEAEAFFMNGMTGAMHRLAQLSNSAFPVTIYYAFKQTEGSDEGTVSTGWETFLEALLRAEFAILGTWPMRTERPGRMRDNNSNALASSIILVCRHRLANATMATRKEFIQALQRDLPGALKALQHGNIAPVDLPQSSIGPGMAIFSNYSKVVEADGSSMTIRTALQLINVAVDEFLSTQEAQMDEWTRFAVTWFSQYGYKQGPFGEAQSIANARNVSVDGVRDAGIIESGSGKVRILRPKELPKNWNPSKDNRLTVWEVVHHLIRILDQEGEAIASEVLRQIGGVADDSRTLCYRLYNVCEQKKWAEDARDYNTLITAWPELTRLAQELNQPAIATQRELSINA